MWTATRLCVMVLRALTARAILSLLAFRVTWPIARAILIEHLREVDGEEEEVK